MIEQVAAAFERQDYQEAARLLRELPAQEPWVQIYQGRLHEITGQTTTAETVYRQLLKTDTGSKITIEARQGLQRLAALEREQQQLKIAQATVEPKDNQLGVLVLESVPTEAKSLTAQKFAQVMKIDPYFARLQLPSRGWRLYRIGRIGELKIYGQALQAAGIPVFWLPLTAIQQTQVLKVCHFRMNGSEVTAIHTNSDIPSTVFTFNWSDVTHRVIGLLPLFESVVDLDARGRLQRKQKTQDYAQICDLHLTSQNCILRLYDGGYQFQQGVHLVGNPEPTQTTSWANWKNLMAFLDRQVQAPVEPEFRVFAETALEQVERLNTFEPHINLFRRVESAWDQTFHLYSCLVLARNRM